ncbi:hypothetical protein MXD61_26920 [Frankia sp. AgPm24]|uniref:hypothetical protein n=1 Tax=Frankia sp. AgPm24 TaxID=631128 RepID=UPI00200E984D|nr:hypothetical protein [Frankia sp. AgPm24]MCK9925461.1 hypothetical protein [Frankia sp. AgPm24]
MADDVPGLLAVALDRFSAFVRTLDGQALSDLVTGRRALTLTPQATAPVDAPPTDPTTDTSVEKRGTTGAPDPAAVSERLAGLYDREEATTYVAGLGSVAVLRRLAGGLGIRGVSKDRREELVRKIVDGTVGVRVSQQAMRNELRS